MTDVSPEPVTEPVASSEPTPSAPTEPAQDNVSELIAKLSKFDPDEITRRLDALETQGSAGNGGSDPLDVVSEWVDGIKHELADVSKQLGKLLAGGGGSPKPAASGQGADTPPLVGTDPQPAEPAPSPPSGSLLSAFTDVPRIG